MTEKGRIKRRLDRRGGTRSVERDFVREFDLEFVRSRKLPYSQAVRSFKRLERDFAQRLNNHSAFVLEIKRRIAEQLLDMALERERSLSICRARLDQNSKLGWSNFDRKFHFHLMYARGMLARRHRQTASRIALELMAELNSRLEALKKLPRQQGRKWILDATSLVRQILDSAALMETDGVACKWDAGGRYIQKK